VQAAGHLLTGEELSRARNIDAYGGAAMRVTVCELPDARRPFEDAWGALVEHVSRERSELLLLPQMPFSEWFIDSAPDWSAWRAAARTHDEWERRLTELGRTLVLGTRPAEFGNERYEEAFAWDQDHGMRSIHANCRPGIGKNGGRWCNEGAAEFTPFEERGVLIGFLIGAEVWMENEARQYGQEGVDVICMPRSAGAEFTRLLEGACQDAAASGAYVLSSNRSGAFGGRGWVIAPDGRVLGMTSESSPFVSLEIETSSERAAAEGRAPQPAPAYIDPLDTGVPPFP
jgi:N-carbamoylputrescine amidase